MADKLFIFARRIMAANKHEMQNGCAMLLVNDAGKVGEGPYHKRALSAFKSNKKMHGICRTVRKGNKGYTWPTRYSENMVDVCPRTFSVA